MASRIRHSFSVLVACGGVGVAWGCVDAAQGPVVASSVATQQVREAPKAGCRATIECEDEGHCSGELGACEALSAKDCVGSRACAKFGACGYDERLGCVPEQESDCAKSRACELEGLCGYADGQCVALRDKDCRKAAPCFERGECFAEHFECVAKTERDCKSSEGCVNDGRCILLAEICDTIDADTRPRICGARWTGRSTFAEWGPGEYFGSYEIGLISVRKVGRRTELSVQLESATELPWGQLEWTAPDEVQVTVYGPQVVPSEQALKSLWLEGAVRQVALVDEGPMIDPNNLHGLPSFTFGIKFEPEGCVDMGAKFVAPTGGKPPAVVLYWERGAPGQ